MEFFRILRVILLVSNVIFLTANAQEPAFYWDKIAFPVFYVTEKSAIGTIANEMMVPVDSTTRQLALVDINFDGLGLKDIVVVLPAGLVYPIDDISVDFARRLLKLPAPPVRTLFFENDSTLLKIDSTKIPDIESIRSLHQIIQKNYQRQPVKLTYTRHQNGIELEIFKFNSFPENLWNSISNSQESDSATSKWQVDSTGVRK